MLLRILTFQFFFAGIWAASIAAAGSSKDSHALLFKDKLCSKDAPTLNISEVCSKTFEPQNDSRDSILKFDSSCDHAAYLVQKLCKITHSDSNLTKTLENNVMALFSTKQNDNIFQFCPRMVQIQKELGYANSSDTNEAEQGMVKCIVECVNMKEKSIEPLCNFILWSWTYIKNSSKALEAPNIMPPASNREVGVKVNSEPNPPSVKSSTTPEQLPPSSNIDAPEPELPQSVDTAKVVENPGSPVKANMPVKDNVNNKGANVEPEVPSSGKETKIVDQTPRQMNEPAVLAGEVKTSEAVTERQDILNKNSIPAKAEEDENLAREGDVNEESHDEMEDQGSNNLEPPGLGKLLPDDKKDVQGPAKNLKNDFNLDGGDIGDGEDTDDEVEPLPKRKKEPFPQSHERMSTVDEDLKKEDLSHFVFLFFIAMCVCIVLYLIYQNKRKIIAMALEGKKGRHSGRRRPTSASYQKLDNKLDEVMASSPPPSKTHVIY